MLVRLYLIYVPETIYVRIRKFKESIKISSKLRGHCFLKGGNVIRIRMLYVVYFCLGASAPRHSACTPCDKVLRNNFYEKFLRETLY